MLCSDNSLCLLNRLQCGAHVVVELSVGCIVGIPFLDFACLK